MRTWTPAYTISVPPKDESQSFSGRTAGVESGVRPAARQAPSNGANRLAQSSAFSSFPHTPPCVRVELALSNQAASRQVVPPPHQGDHIPESEILRMFPPPFKTADRCPVHPHAASLLAQSGPKRVEQLSRSRHVIEAVENRDQVELPIRQRSGHRKLLGRRYAIVVCGLRVVRRNTRGARRQGFEH